MTSSNIYEAGLAIDCLSNICTPDLARDLAADVVSMLNSSRPYIRKKACLVLYKIFLKFPDALRPAEHQGVAKLLGRSLHPMRQPTLDMAGVLRIDRAQMFTPPFRTVLLKSVGLAVLLLIMLGIGLERVFAWLSAEGAGYLEGVTGAGWHTPLQALLWIVTITLGVGLFAGAVSVMGFLAYLVAARSLPLGPVSAVRETSVIFGAVLGTIVLKEGFGLRRIAAATLRTVGIVLLAVLR